jgi:hypothetical protein
MQAVSVTLFGALHIKAGKVEYRWEAKLLNKSRE